MKLEIGQKWISEEFPHESFIIYDGIIDICDCNAEYDENFENHAEKCKIYFWKRIDDEAYDNFLLEKVGRLQNTYPYASCGECKKSSLSNKIKKYNMICL